MASATTNPILKYIVGGVLLILVIAVLQTGDEKKPEDKTVVTTDLEEFDIQEGDSTKDTISTLVAHVRTLKKDTEALLEENKLLRNQNRDIDEAIKKEIDIKSREQEKRQQQLQAQANNNNKGYFDSLSKKVEKLQKNLSIQKSELANKGDIPEGLGFDDGFENSQNGWIMPTDLPPVDDPRKRSCPCYDTKSSIISLSI